MSNPIAFPSVTATLSLPLLYAGQAQKEFFINQAFSVLDAIWPRAVAGSLATPPSTPDEGTAYRVLANADGDWTGHDNEISLWIGGSWTFVPPSDGMVIFDQGASHSLCFKGGWQAPIEPVAPTGGTTIDVEARSAIDGLTEALRSAGILPPAS